jgi:lysophospholipase L1-like esterase
MTGGFKDCTIVLLHICNHLPRLQSGDMVVRQSHEDPRPRNLHMPTNSTGNALKATIVIFLALIVVLSATELGLRALEQSGRFANFFEIFGNAQPPLDKRTGPGMYYAHPYTGYAMKPGYTRSNAEKINSLGFRGEEIEAVKPDGVYRIIAIGGSTTFGVYLPWYETYPYLLQQELRERFNTDKIEVINAGLTGSTSAESFHRLATQVLPADPDMVVIYHAFNDLLPRMFNDYQDDYYHFRRSDPNNPPGMTRFYTYRLMLRVLSPGMFHENYNMISRVWKMENLPATDTQRTQNFLDSNNDAFKENLENIIILLKGKDIEVVIASFGMNIKLWHWLDNLPPYVWKSGIDENNVAIEELSEEQNIPLIPFADIEFRKGSRQAKTPMFSDSIHMSAEGNLLKAKAFADTIAPIVARDMNLPEPPPAPYIKAPRAN